MTFDDGGTMIDLTDQWNPDQALPEVAGDMDVDQLNKLKVLVVDDDWQMTRLVRANLRSDRVEVAEAGTAEDGLRILRAGGIDLILLDVNLPDMSGWDVLALIRASETLRNIPVIVVSVEPADGALVRRFKPEGYMQKPLDVRALVGRMNRLASRRYGQDLSGQQVEA